jgi:hypothetical protein
MSTESQPVLGVIKSSQAAENLYKNSRKLPYGLRKRFILPPPIKYLPNVRFDNYDIL